ncbi:MAG: hypothetical protein KatS3mg110_0020 [Pirellulaceae bacterium]|nr:MAG: hypothetical protein KatS3mg110_0020 [Pirellulaceae bacterium]
MKRHGNLFKQIASFKAGDAARLTSGTLARDPLFVGHRQPIRCGFGSG